MMAFLLSLVTAVISAWSGYRKDIHEQQAQLAASLQSLQDLMVKQVEITSKYQGMQQAQIYNLVNSQVNTILRNSAEIALRLGKDASTAELVTIAQGVTGLGLISEGRKLLETALAAAGNVNDESVALRFLGSLEVKWATSPEMRDQGESRFRQAGNLETKWPGIDKIAGVVPYLKAVAELQWADAIAPLNCIEARKHYANGQEFLANAPSTPDIEQLRRAADIAAKAGLGGAENCKP